VRPVLADRPSRRVRVDNENHLIDRITGWTGCHGSNLQIQEFRILELRIGKLRILEFRILGFWDFEFLNSRIP